MKRVAALVCLWLLPSAAFAQTPAASGAATEIDAVQAQLDRDYAQALASDCALACRALDSMRRSADRLCQLDPGDRCARAKEKVESASARVKAACPACGEQLGGQAGTGTTAAPPPAPSPAPPAERVQAAEEVAASKRGCGCHSASSPADAVAPLALGALVLVALRRRRR